jgi:serine/threonine-protein kinase
VSAARVDQLVAQGQLEQAAALCAERGDHLRASELLEQACDFAAAADQARAAGDLRRALRLALFSGGGEPFEEARRALLASGDAGLIGRSAAELADRQHYSHAGELYRAIERWREAADCFERAGAALDAAGCHERLGSPADAARLLEAALRAPQHGADVDHLRLELGTLYARHGRHRPAVRMLQQLGPNSRWRQAALPDLAQSLEALGLQQALQDLRAELRGAGIDGAAPASDADPGSQRATTAGGGVLFGRYRVAREVATTPHAKVMEAVDQLSGKRVAVKLFASRLAGSGRDALQRFVREARALAKLRHSNVVPLVEYAPQGPALVMEWMAGGSLEDLMARESLSPARAAEIAMALLSALAEAHRLGILHRDVKPANLLFDGAGTARLADFGAAHLETSAATVTAADIGTLAYMAPEQRRGEAATVQSDVYAVGMLLFVMLGGEADGARLAAQVQSFHPDLDDDHDALIASLLAQQPQRRPDGALAARNAIDALVWPTRVVARSRPAIVRDSSGVVGERFGPARGGATPPSGCAAHHDHWLGRDVWQLALDEPRRLLAVACARVDHPRLPLVLRADPNSKQLWLAAPVGPSLAARGDRLRPPERAALRDAVAALHAAGVAHGAINPHHVYLEEHGPVLAFPAEPKLDACDLDRRSLEQL